MIARAFVFCGLFLSFLFSLKANEPSADLIQQYKDCTMPMIADIRDDLPSRVIFIELSDGTLWECHYPYMEFRQKVLQSWRIGSKAYIMGRSLYSDETFGIWAKEGGGIALIAYLNSNTADKLPKIANITGETVELTDGSIWREKCTLYSSFSRWNVGDRIVVSYLNNQLINLEHPRGVFFDTFYANVKLVDWKNQ